MNRLFRCDLFLLMLFLLLPITTMGQTVTGGRPYLGLRAVSAGMPAAREMGIESPSGAAILRVTPGGPAAKAGLQRGDLIVEFGGKEINNLDELEAAALQSPVGSRQRVILVRNHQRFQADLVIGSQDAAPQNAAGAQPGTSLPNPQPNGGGNATQEAKPLATVVAKALQFRIDAAADFDNALKQNQAERVLGFLTRGDQSMAKARSFAWSAFFAGSLVLMGHVDSPEPVVAFYNPLYDAVLLTRWSGQGEGGLMTAADLRVASVLGSEGNRELPPYAAWLQAAAKRKASEVFSAECDRLLQAFDKTFPPQATSIARIATSANVDKIASLVEVQAFNAIRNVAAIQNPKGPQYNGRIKELRDALVRHDRDQLAQMVPAGSATGVDSLLEIPEEYSQHLVPCYALLDPKGSMVFLQDTALPRFYMLIYFRQGVTADKPEIRSVVFFELAQDI